MVLERLLSTSPAMIAACQKQQANRSENNRQSDGALLIGANDAQMRVMGQRLSRDVTSRATPHAGADAPPSIGTSGGAAVTARA
jgi:hypothetical protein